MAEFAFLTAVREFLAAQPLTPVVPATRIASIEPSSAGELPSIVLSLPRTTRRRVGLGDRSDLMSGALRVRVVIDLANPILPTDSTFQLIDQTRQNVILPHGGLVHADGTEAAGLLGEGDITVALNGGAITVVTRAPLGGEVRADPVGGQLQLGDPLPLNGSLSIEYFLGQWERRVERIVGDLRIDVCTGTSADAAQLGASCAARLLTPEAITEIVQLLSIELTAVGSVEQQPASPGPPPSGITHFRRRLEFSFEYQHLVDRADSSGGVIRRIPLVSRVSTARVDRVTGNIVTDVVVETT